MNSATTTTAGVPASIIAAYDRALARAAVARWTDRAGIEHTGLVAYRTSDPTAFEVPAVSAAGHSHTVRLDGDRLCCDCAGAGHLACVHRAVVRHGLRHHVFAVRPTAPVIDLAAERARLAAVNATVDALFA